MTMESPHYLFYDIESSGLNKSFDQVFQFAGIWTDLDLNEIKREEIIVKLNPDVIPHPQASITHHISLEQLADGVSEYAAIRQIHAWFNQPGCLTLGYNTLGFDDEFLRFSFYRNLLDPYSHQYAHGCGRLDLFPITVMYYLFKPDLIAWPSIDGRPSLKLDAISELNQLATGPAHNAMVDVEATVALARRLAKDQAMWRYCLEHFTKQHSADRLAKLDTIAIEKHNYPTSLMIHAKFGAKKSYQSPVLCLGEHQVYRNQSVWLRLDTVSFASCLDALSHDAIAENDIVDTIACRACEQSWLLPWQNRFSKHLTAARQSLAEANLTYLQHNPQTLSILREHFLTKTWPENPLVDAQAALYTRPFTSRETRQQFNAFHAAGSAEEKHQQSLQFTEEIDRELALRLLGRNFYTHLPETAQEAFNSYLRHCYQDDAPRLDYQNNPALTFDRATQEIIRLKQQPTEHEPKADEQLQLLHKLQQYLSQMKLKNKSVA